MTVVAANSKHSIYAAYNISHTKPWYTSVSSVIYTKV